jgi:cell wall-associated NlpC family hydrolase
MKKILFLLYCHASLIAHKGLVVVPVADLVGSPIQAFNLAHSAHASYQKLPLCGSIKSSSSGCPRLHQLLFNETVEIIDKHDNEYCIAIPHLFYTTATNAKPQNMYWTSCKNIVPYKTLEKFEIDTSKIPSMPCFKKCKNIEDADDQVVVLLFPWYDATTNTSYSAGTRFVLTQESSEDQHYTVYILDWQNHMLTTTHVPKTSAFIQKSSTKKEAIRQFVTIIRAWAHHYHGYIPYVWGGSSFIDACKENSFHQASVTYKTKKTSVMARKDCNRSTKSGFDCAGLFARAAQMAGIPYFFKNTLTLAQHLQPLQPGQKLIEGDLMWIPGHVMAVSDIKNNVLIEARGYSHGFGIVQEIELSKVFKDITTYDQLIDAFLHHKPIERLNKDGVPVETIKTIKLLKIESAWDFSHQKL